MSYNASYDTFREEYPDFKVSKTKFRQMRPMDVQPSYRNKKRKYLCEYCTNIDLKLEALSRYAASHRLQDICVKDRYEMSRLTLCPKGQTGEHKKACLDRKCDECGTSTIQECCSPCFRWMRVSQSTRGRLSHTSRMVRRRRRCAV